MPGLKAVPSDLERCSTLIPLTESCTSMMMGTGYGRENLPWRSRSIQPCTLLEGAAARSLVASLALSMIGATAVAALLQAMVPAALDQIPQARATTARDALQLGHARTCSWHRPTSLHAASQ
jgi:hypothetical protein